MTIAAVGIIAGGVSVLMIIQPGARLGSPDITGSTIWNDTLVTQNKSQDFPAGYYSEAVDVSRLTNGEVIDLAGVPFNFVIPPTTITSGTQTIEVDYTCSSYFYATISNGSVLVLDTCSQHAATRTTYVTTTTTTGGGTGFEVQGYPASWGVWELSKGTVPIVGVHLEGVGDRITLTELVVSR